MTLTNTVEKSFCHYLYQNVLGSALRYVFSLKCTARRYYDGVLGALEQTGVKCLAQGPAVPKTSMSKGHYPIIPSKDENCNSLVAREHL